MKKIISLTFALFSSLLVSACVTVPLDPQVNKNQLAISSVRDIPISYSAGSQFSLAPKYVEETSLKAEQTQAVYKLYADAIIANLTVMVLKILLIVLTLLFMSVLELP